LSQGAYSITVQVQADASPLTALTQVLTSLGQNVQTTITSINNVGTAIQSMGSRVSSATSPLTQLTSAEQQVVSTSQQLSGATQQLASGVGPLANQFTNLTSATQRVGAIFQQTVGTSTQLGQSLTQMVGSQSALANAGSQLTGVLTQEQAALNSTVNIAQRADLQFKQMVGSNSALASSVQGVSGGLTQENTLLQQSGTAAGTSATAHQSLGQTFQSLTFGIAALATGVLGLITGYTSLEKSQLAVDRASKMVTSSQAMVLTTQKALESAIAKYGSTSKEAEAATLRHTAAVQGLSVNNERLRLAQTTLNERMAEFATNILPQIISIGAGVAQVFSVIQQNAAPIGALFTRISEAIMGTAAAKDMDTAATEANTIASVSGSEATAAATTVDTEATFANTEANVANAEASGATLAIGETSIGVSYAAAAATGVDTEAVAANTIAQEANATAATGSIGGIGKLKTALTGLAGGGGFAGVTRAALPAGEAVVGVGEAAVVAEGGAVALTPALGGMGTAAEGAATGAIAAEAGIGGMSLAIPVLGIAIAAGVAALIAYQTNFLGFRDVVNQAAAALAEFGATVQRVLTAGVAEVFGPLIKGVSDFGASAGKAFTDAFDAAAGGIGKTPLIDLKKPQPLPETAPGPSGVPLGQSLQDQQKETATRVNPLTGMAEKASVVAAQQRLLNQEMKKTEGIVKPLTGTVQDYGASITGVTANQQVWDKALGLNSQELSKASAKTGEAEAAAKKITVEPITPKAKNTVGTKPWNKYEAPAPAVENSRFVKETRTGIRVICDHCGHSFTHFSKNLYSQYFGSCSRCHLNVRLRHYQRG